jgi:hypothetical protein
MDTCPYSIGHLSAIQPAIPLQVFEGEPHATIASACKKQAHGQDRVPA